MRLTFLGTGAGSPTLKRNTSAIAFSGFNQRGDIWLFDCGEGTLRQCMRAEISIQKINKILLTHLHGDHLFGLPGLLSSRAFQYNTRGITVYGPPGLKHYLDTVFAISESRIGYPLTIVELDAGTVFKDDTVQIECDYLNHRIMTFGYRIIFSSNAQTIPAAKEKIITIFGDTRPHLDADHLVRHADVFVHESSYGAELEEKADAHGHCTTVQAAEIARRNKVKQLIVTHISSRYYSENQGQSLMEECRSVFPQTELAADLWSYTF